MPSINVSEADYATLYAAAHDAQDSGDIGQAEALDKLARKVSAALTTATTGMRLAAVLSGSRKPLRWTDVPSVFDSPNVPRDA